MTVLTQSAVVLFGNLRYDTHTIALSANLVLLPGSSEVRCVLPAGVRLEAAPGDAAEITLGNGEKEERVLTGTVGSVARALNGAEISAVDGAGLMALSRPADTLQSKAPGEMIRSLASAVNAPVGRLTLNQEPMPYYAATQHRTAAEHVASLAELGGGIATIDGEGKINAFLRPVPPADAAIKYGRELLDVRVSEERPEADVAVIGAGAAASAGDPRALQTAVAALAGEASAASGNLRWRPLPALRTPGAQKAAAQEARARRAARGRRISASCWLQPHLRPGMLLEVQDLPDGFAGGPWLLTNVSHQLDRRGGYTRFEGVDGGAGSGGLLGALGGLL